MPRRDSRGCRWPSSGCSSRLTCGARCRFRLDFAGSAERRSAPVSSGRSRPSCRTTMSRRRGDGMRRLSFVLLAFTLTGCDAWRDAFSARAEIVARANDQILTVDRLAQLAGSGKQVPLEPMALSRLAHVWIDYALFAQALAH